MSDSLRPDLAQLVGLFVEAILYGVYLLTFAQVLTRILVIPTPPSSSYPSSPLPQRHRDRILRHRRGSSGTTTTCALRIKPLSRIHLPTLLVALLLWVNGTLNISLGMVRAAQTFVYRTGGTGLTWIGITKSFTVSVQIMLADGMLVYRCWRAYNKSITIILLPMLLWIVGAGATIWTLYLNVNASGKQLYMGVQYPLSCVFWAFTMGLNIYTTSTIIYRIWSVDREAHRPRYDTTSSLSNADSSHSTLREPPRNPAVILLTRRTHSRLQGAIKIVFTSGLIYTLTSITVFASEIAKSNAIYITSAADIMAIGLAFNLMVISTDNERVKDDEQTQLDEKMTQLRFTSDIERGSRQVASSYSQSDYRSTGCATTTQLGSHSEVFVKEDHSQMDMDLETGLGSERDTDDNKK